MERCAESLPPIQTKICSRCNHTLLCKDRKVADALRCAQDALREGLCIADVDSSCVSEQVAAFDADIDLYDDEILTLEHTLHQLRVKRADLQRAADANRSLAAPIRRLPVETLTAIFCHVPVERTAACQAVCFSWRAIILSHPLEFLPRILVRSQPIEHIERRRRVLHDQLLMTRPKPVCFTLEDIRSVTPQGFLSDHPRMISHGPLFQHPVGDDPVLNSSEQWRSVSLSLSSDSLRSLGGIERPIPQLTSLSLAFTKPYIDRGGSDAISRLVMFEEAPLLRRVSLRPPFVPSCTVLPYAQLTHITIAGMDWTQLAYILERCPRLASVRVYPGTGRWPTDVVAETGVTTLDVGSSVHPSAAAARSLFTSISARHLSTLVLRFLPDPEALGVMIERSKCTIASLVLDLKYILATEDDAQITQRIVRMLPHVRNFDLTLDTFRGAATFTRPLLSEMSGMAEEGVPRLLPLMRRFSFRVVNCQPGCEQELVQLTKARMRSGEFSCLRVACPLPKACVEELRALSDDGLDLYGLKECEPRFMKPDFRATDEARLQASI